MALHSPPRQKLLEDSSHVPEGMRKTSRVLLLTTGQARKEKYVFMAVETLKSEQGPYHITMSGKVDKDQLEQVTSFLEQALKTDEHLSLLMEIKDFQGMTVQAMIGDLLYGLRHFGDLYRFDKIAVVVEQNWLKNVVKWEAMVLRKKDMRVFDTSERVEALTWVRDAKEAVVGGLTYSDSPAPDLLVVGMSGKVTGFDMRELKSRINAICDEHGKANLLVKWTKFPKLGEGLIVEEFRMFDLLGKIERYAVVGEQKWLKAYAAMANPLLRLELRHFEDEAEAFQWVQGGDASETPAGGDT